MILPKDARDRAKFGDASLRAALEMTETTASTESRRIIDEMAREKGSRPSVIVAQIVSDHIRAVAQEMKATADEAEDSNEHEAAKYLRDFADKLEGKQS